jgi:MFS family permease
MNALLQLFLPSWVRARGISIYLMVFFGSQALGAVLWGAIAAPAGLRATFLAAAGLMLAGAATIPLRPLIDTGGMGRDTAVYWPEPTLVVNLDPTSGPVVVETRYTIATAREQQFLEAMSKVRLSRLRTGATQWGLFRDSESEHVFVEFFVVGSWEEHLRQHSERQTGVDHAYEEEADTLSDPPPQVSHLISAG